MQMTITRPDVESASIAEIAVPSFEVPQQSLGVDLDFGINQPNGPVDLTKEQLTVWDNVSERAIELGIDEQEEIQTAAELIRTYEGFFPPLATHSMNVGLNASRLAEDIPELGVTKEDGLIAGVYHDIGKLQVPRNIVITPGRINWDQVQKMGKHSEYGYYAAKNLGLSKTICNVIGTHHKTQDRNPVGMGIDLTPYQSSLRAVLTIADYFDARMSRNDGHVPEEADVANRLESVAVHVITTLAKTGFNEIEIDKLTPKIIKSLVETRARTNFMENSREATEVFAKFGRAPLRHLAKI